MRRFLHLFHRTAADRALADEMREHLEEKIDELVDAGMSRDAARAEARRRFGSPASVAERSRDEWAYPRLENLLQDLRYAFRSLARNPLFAAVVVLPLALRAQVRTLDPQVSLYDVRSMEEVIANSPATFLRRYPAFLIGIFAAIALLMAAIGIYGMVAYAVAQRRHEIGIRIALGAQRRDIFTLVIGQGMALVLVGVVMGLAGAALITRVLGKLLFGVQPLDPATFIAVVAVLLTAALMASYIPALRATKVEPGVVLGSE